MTDAYNHSDGADAFPMPATTTHDDGTVTIETPHGATITTQLDGSICLDYAHIKTVGFVNIMAVEHHNISHLLGMAAHFVKFHSGAELRFSYNQQGHIIELSFAGLNAKINAEGQLMFTVCEPGTPSQVEFEVTVQ
jgi:hypothetical protein